MHSPSTPSTPLPESITAEIDAALIPRSQPTSGSTRSRSIKHTLERPDERCWIRCNQSNARRALGREPKCTAWCYISMRRQLAALTPVPGLPGAYQAADQPIPAPALPPIPTASSSSSSFSSTDSSEPPLPPYHWPWLDGRYIYRASGRELVAKHMVEMSVQNGVEQIREIEKRCEESAIKRVEENTREKRAMRRAMGMDAVQHEWESMTSLSALYSTSLGRFHAHVSRIYSPGLQNLSRLPTTFTDGTQLAMLSTVWTKLSDGSAFVLGERMYTSTQEVIKKLKERRSSGAGGSGEGGKQQQPPTGQNEKGFRIGPIGIFYGPKPTPPGSSGNGTSTPPDPNSEGTVDPPPPPPSE